MCSFICAAAGFVFLTGCTPPPTRVSIGDREQILHRGNGAEPQDIDPQTVTGVIEDHIIVALFEGLVSEDPHDLHPVPGVAERWDISDDKKTYTFHLRRNARWSNGAPVTAQDFVRSYRRILMPSLAAEYAYMLYVAVNAEEFNTGKITDFSQVGFKALDDFTLEVRLKNPTPYFLSLLNHYSWFPVPISVIERCGPIDQRGNRWTRPENFVGNGPFRLTKWKVNDVLVVKKNATYWDADKVRLREIRFYPVESHETEARAFQAGQLHMTYEAPLSKIDYYKKYHPELLRIDPFLGTYIYRFNVTKPPLNDKRVRRALAMTVDRVAIATRIRRAGEIPAYSFTPPDTAGYTCRAKLPYDPEQARKLLAEAGYPNGQSFPKLTIMFNTLESHKAIAEAVQEMWKKELNIEVELENQEWKVYIDNQRTLNYQIGRYAWIGDYVDPNSFLDMFITDGGNNQTGWSNKEYDRLIAEAGRTGDQPKRYELFQKAEGILLDEAPMVPVYHYVQPFLIQPSVQGWYPTILDHHPYKYVWLQPRAGNETQ
ncbi:MAG: peptide ABC transporter substrate-binding protein [Verrucomicrobia bacterium]|nr:peptide ABC transporter substrate-binding protein [Verrucomicrobiota bacterium]